MNKQLIAILISLYFIFPNCNKPDSYKWESKNYSFEIEYSNNWTLYEESDKKERLLFGLMDTSDGKQYQIDMTTQSEYKNLSDEEYFNKMKEYYLSLNEKNRFLNEEEIYLHGKIFRGNSFLLYSPKYGTLKLYDVVNRNKDLVIGIMIYFPVDQNKSQTQKIPHELSELDSHVKINGK
jgi:hypothetical protein